MRRRAMLQGRYALLQDTTKELSSIVNQGRIRAEDGGMVALVAPIVDNEGAIVAAAGRVILHADARFFLDTPDPGGGEVAGGQPHAGRGQAVGPQGLQVAVGLGVDQRAERVGLARHLEVVRVAARAHEKYASELLHHCTEMSME